MIKPGRTKMMDDSVPAADATVCTMLFSWIVASRKPRRIAIEITAAGMEVEKVRPALRPKYTLAAVNTSVMTTPIISPRIVSSAGELSRSCRLAFTMRLAILNHADRNFARPTRAEDSVERPNGSRQCSAIWGIDPAALAQFSNAPIIPCCNALPAVSKSESFHR